MKPSPRSSTSRSSPTSSTMLDGAPELEDPAEAGAPGGRRCSCRSSSPSPRRRSAARSSMRSPRVVTRIAAGRARRARGARRRTARRRRPAPARSGSQARGSWRPPRPASGRSLSKRRCGSRARAPSYWSRCWRDQGLQNVQAAILGIEHHDTGGALVECALTPPAAVKRGARVAGRSRTERSPHPITAGELAERVIAAARRAVEHEIVLGWGGRPGAAGHLARADRRPGRAAQTRA